MKFFQCSKCLHPVFFENTVCENCSAPLGYLSSEQVLVALEKDGDAWTAVEGTGQRFHYCRNHDSGVCNWLIPAAGEKTLCSACELNRTIPNLGDPGNVAAWQNIEAAKHRLIYSIHRFGLPLQNKAEAPATGLAFDFLSDEGAPPNVPGISTGHTRGCITINIAEADPAHREWTRTRMAEPYRTLIGHFRHEIGHYYWERLVRSAPDTLTAFRGLFGDERTDYAAALQQYYDDGPPPDWPERFLTAYAASHPWEDWAETWAHYFHIVDTLETAYAFGFRLRPRRDGAEAFCMQADFDPYRQPDFDAIIAAGIPLTLAVNSLNRSMGQPDLYPFVLPPPAREKLRFIHRLIKEIPPPA